MDINLRGNNLQGTEIFLGIVGFVIATLLIPALIYIWNLNKKEMESLKSDIVKHLDGSVEFRSQVSNNITSMRNEVNNKINEVEDSMYHKVNEIEKELRTTKINYVQRFADLRDQINEKFNTTNQHINNLALDVKEVVTLIKSNVAKNGKGDGN